jgi:hypothetical protein
MSIFLTPRANSRFDISMQQKVDYVVLRRGEKYTKYYDEWLEKSIPSPRAELVPLPPIAGAEKFVIHNWRRARP